MEKNQKKKGGSKKTISLKHNHNLQHTKLLDTKNEVIMIVFYILSLFLKKNGIMSLDDSKREEYSYKSDNLNFNVVNKILRDFSKFFKDTVSKDLELIKIKANAFLPKKIVSLQDSLSLKSIKSYSS